MSLVVVNEGNIMEYKGMKWIVVGDRNRETPVYKVMRSRVTGKLTTYTLSYNRPPRLEPFEIWDTEYMKQELQNEADSRGLDVIFENVYHFRVEGEGDYLASEQWVPVETLSNGISLLDPATLTGIVLLFKWFIATIIVATIAAIAIYFFVIRPLTTPPEPYKGFYQADYETGDVIGPFTHTEYITYKQAEHSDCFVCRYCGEVFCPEDYGGDVEAARRARDEHEKNCPWKGSPWLNPSPTGGLDIGGLITLLAYGGIAILGVMLGLQVIQSLAPRGE